MAIQRHVSFGGHSVLEQMVLLEQGIASLLVMVNRFTVCSIVKSKTAELQNVPDNLPFTLFTYLHTFPRISFVRNLMQVICT
jgi:hypothetical protein